VIVITGKSYVKHEQQSSIWTPELIIPTSISDIDKIKAEATWSDETLRWKLPDVALIKTKLPPAGIGTVILTLNYNILNSMSLISNFLCAGLHNNNKHNANNNNNRVPSRTAPARLESDNEDEDDENHRSILVKVKVM